jgi:LacI family transcriptional regulator
VPYIDLVACGLSASFSEQSSFFSELVAMFSAQGAQNHQGIRLHEIPTGEPVSSYETLFTRADFQACVLIGLHSPYLTEMFDKHEVAWVSLFPNNSYNLQRAIVSSNDVVKLQLEHLWSLGHEKIAYLHGVNEQSPSRTLLLRRESYYRLMAEKGYKVLPEWVQYITYKDIDVEAACRKVFSSEEKPTAVISPDPILASVYRFIEKQGMRIGKDVSVVANDDLAITRNLSPAVTTVNMPMELIVKRTLDTLTDVMLGNEVPDIYQLPAKLIVRESTAPIR